MVKLKGVFDKVLDVIQNVEATAGADVKGSGKKALAVAAINACIDIPMLPEFVEAQIFSGVIGLLVDFGVYIHNKFDLFAKTEQVAAVVEQAADAAATIPNEKVSKAAKKTAKVAEVVEQVADAVDEEVDQKAKK